MDHTFEMGKVYKVETFSSRLKRSGKGASKLVIIATERIIVLKVFDRHMK